MVIVTRAMTSNGRGTTLKLIGEEGREGFQEEVVFRLCPGERVGVIQQQRREKTPLGRENSTSQRPGGDVQPTPGTEGKSALREGAGSKRRRGDRLAVGLRLMEIFSSCLCNERVFL